MAKSFFSPRLVNGPAGDPALYVEIGVSGRAALFDLGSVEALKPAELLRVGEVFVTHAHMDHFFGFDHFLRLHVGREKRVRMFGPEGFLEHVRGKLAGYAWNLVEGPSLEIEAVEVRRGETRTQSFRMRDSFRPTEAPRAGGTRGDVLFDDPLYSVSVAELDHRIPCLGFSAREKDRMRVDSGAVEAAGLEPGPWVGDLKDAVARGDPPDTAVRAGEREYRLEEAAAQFLRLARGEKIAYVTDAIRSPPNAEKIVRLAREADEFFCEGGFLEEDSEKARRNFHLTAREAGELARLAGARELRIFHYSPKYVDRFQVLSDEARSSFGG
jgi:ribonuclease Z